MKNIIAIIPARGGSKRLPRKNLALLNGKPLLVYAIEQAKASEYISRIIVTSEDDEILRIARMNGADVIKLPEALAQGEEGSILKVIKHVLNYLERYDHTQPLYYALIQCTSPLRTTADIDNTIKLMFDTGADSAETKCGDKENGAVYVAHRMLIMERNRILGDNPAIYQMPEERSIDIDTQGDLDKAESILRGENDNSGQKVAIKSRNRRGRTRQK